MNKPDFSQMSRKELKTYIRQHPTDNEAIRELSLFYHYREVRIKKKP